MKQSYSGNIMADLYDRIREAETDEEAEQAELDQERYNDMLYDEWRDSLES